MTIFTAFISDECKIGDDCIFANRCTIVTENHGMNPEKITISCTKPYQWTSNNRQKLLDCNGCDFLTKFFNRR